jgi:excisionase family DNA binding protein
VAAPDRKRRRRRPAPLALTIDETAARLHVSPRTVRRMIERGDLVSFHVGRAHRIAVSEVDAFIRRDHSR